MAYDPTIVKKLNEARAAAADTGGSTTAGNLANYDAFAASLGGAPVPPPVVPPPGTTPAQAYKDLQLGAYEGGDADAAISSVLGRASKDALGGIPSESQIYRQKLKMYQTEIDATNQIYAEKLRQQATQNQSNRGSGYAVAARSGTLGSDFGLAQDAKIVEAGNQATNLIQQELSAKVNGILGLARKDAADELAAKRAAQSQGVKDYLEYLGKQAERRSAAVSKVANAILDQGLAITDIDPTKLADIAKQYGLTPAQVAEQYAAEKKKRDEAKAEAEAKAIKDNSFNIGEGESYYKYDPATGDYTLVASKPKTFAPDEGVDPNRMLTIAEAKTLGVPYGTTVSQATAMGKTPGVPVGQSETTQNILGLIGQLEGLDTDAIAGIPSIGAFFPGTGTQRTANIAKQLGGLLSLENRTLLKGSGAISDYEARTLDRAASALGINSETGRSNLSNADFKAELAKLKAELAAEASSGGAAGGTPPTADELQELRTLFPGKTDDELIREATGGGETSFNGVGNTTASIQIPASSRLAYVNNNPGNLRFAGQTGAAPGAGGFAKFATAAAGFNALVHQVALDASRGHTVASFISKFAPPSENDTGTYIRQALAALGAKANTPLAALDKKLVAKFVAKKESSTRILG